MQCIVQTVDVVIAQLVTKRLYLNEQILTFYSTFDKSAEGN